VNWLRACVGRYAAVGWPWRALAALAWAGLIFVMSARPAGALPGPRLHPLVHNAAHVVVFAVLAALVRLAFGARRDTWVAAVAWLLAAVYGATDEYHQSLVPGRVASLGDLAADACGAALGLAVLAWLWRGDLRARAFALGLAPLALAVVCFETWA
jgi:VanZ family protein